MLAAAVDRRDPLRGLGRHGEGDQARLVGVVDRVPSAVVAAVSPGWSCWVWPIARIWTFW